MSPEPLYASGMPDEVRLLGDDERALFAWFFAQWPELAALEADLAFDLPADVFALAEDGYRTLAVKYRAGVQRPPLPSPYLGEAEAVIEGNPFDALFFIGDDTVMLELIWSAGTWPGRLPRPDELQPAERPRDGRD